MRRNVQVFHLAKARSTPLRRRIAWLAVDKWPEHPKLAYAILRDELKLPENVARQVLLDSISHANACCNAVNRCSDAKVEAALRRQLAQAFKRVGNCCR